MCNLLNPVQYILTIKIIEVYFQCFNGSVSQSEFSKSTSRAKISSFSPVHLKTLKSNQIWSTLLTFVNAPYQRKK